VKVYNNGVRIIFLDDRGLNKEHKIIPMTMVVGRLHRKLLYNKVRHLTSIVSITGEVITPHDAAVMIAYKGGIDNLYQNQ
jgi:glutamate synthase (NADPH/NADH) large chain